jgi:hypothetical protein
LTVGLLLAGTSASFAQINPFKGNGHPGGLTKADVNMVFAAAGHLNSKDPIAPGDSEDWSNPASGNSGKVTVEKVFKSAGLSCHGLHYDLHYKTNRPDASYTADWCKTKSGEWKIKG